MTPDELYNELKKFPVSNWWLEIISRYLCERFEITRRVK
jgi:hypothetical protein